MARGRKPKAGGLRPDQRKQVKQLEEIENPEVPPMPDPDQWIPTPGGEDDPAPAADWYEPVKAWWDDIWSSPMSSEFVESDIHGLYMACVYMHEGLNPYYKVSDRLKMMQAFEKTIKDYGLTPTAREALRWQISQGTQAQNRTNQIRAQQDAETRAQALREGKDKVIDLYKKFG